MLTFNLELDYKANKKGEKLLMIRLSKAGNHKRISTGIHIMPKNWDKAKKQVKKSHPLALQLNKTISNKITEIEEKYIVLLKDGTDFSLDELLHLFQKPKSQNFFEFAYNFKLEPIRVSKKLGTFRRYEAVLNKLKEFAGKSLTLNQIDYTLIKEFEQFLTVTKGNSIDTVSSNLSVIRTIINEAERHSLFTKKNPFNNVSLKYTNNSKNKLTIEELKRFSTAALPNIKSLHLARDFFMACFYAAGTRAGDMVTMKWEQIKDGSLCFAQIKTGKVMQIPILKDLQLIFDRLEKSTAYIFPFFKPGEKENEQTINSKITYINKYIKEVCKYAGIVKKISSHCARHTFSDISLSLNQNDIFGLRDALGHSSVKTTEGYLQNRNYGQSKTYLQNIENLLK